jgi:hypothetical protein
MNPFTGRALALNSVCAGWHVGVVTLVLLGMYAVNMSTC